MQCYVTELKSILYHQVEVETQLGFGAGGGGGWGVIPFTLHGSGNTWYLQSSVYYQCHPNP